MPTGHVIEDLAGIAPASAIVDAIAARAEIMSLSQAAHDAVLIPREPGGLSHGERAALAERMARLGWDEALAARHAALLDRAGDKARLAAVGDPERVPDEPRLRALVVHADLLTRAPRQATRASIAALREAGISEPDVVRLSELAAFVGYQMRVIAGLRLMRDVA